MGTLQQLPRDTNWGRCNVDVISTRTASVTSLREEPRLCQNSLCVPYLSVAPDPDSCCKNHDHNIVPLMLAAEFRLRM
jgi:hypothetical protein